MWVRIVSTSITLSIILLLRDECAYGRSHVKVGPLPIIAHEGEGGLNEGGNG